jgi:hypothetical protein
MRLSTLSAIAFAMFALPAAAQQQTCPALDRAHAAQVLQADPQLQIEWRGAQDYTCHYSAAAATLEITVAPYVARRGWPAYAAGCADQQQKMSGIGDEAVTCASAPQQARLLGHVRDTLFDLRLQLPAVRAGELGDTLREAGQRVAGNLF